MRVTMTPPDVMVGRSSVMVQRHDVMVRAGPRHDRRHEGHGEAGTCATTVMAVGTVCRHSHCVDGRFGHTQKKSWRLPERHGGAG